MGIMNMIGRILIGCYEIIDMIAMGGQSDVYKAINNQTGQSFVIKFLSTSPTDPHYAQELARFKRAASTIINHPRIVDPLHFGEENGDWFIIYPYIEGANLDDYVAAQGGRLPVADTISIAGDAAEALAAIHSRRIVHRDIKPANFIIGPDGRGVLIDLGICRNLDQPTITNGLGMLGTPPWIPPEQQKGASTVDHRCDLYALGLLVCYMLTGQQPSDSGQPPYGPLRLIDSAIPAPLDHLCQRLLTPDPGARIQTAQEVLTALRAISVAGAQAYCMACGQLVEANTRYCLSCGSLQRRDFCESVFCLACGTVTTSQSACTTCSRSFSASRHCLRFIAGGCLVGRTYLIPECAFEVGRQQLDPHDTFVSRRHFRMICNNGSVSIQDVGSTNVTLVSGQPAVQPVQLQPGQEIRIAGHRAIYQLFNVP